MKAEIDEIGCLRVSAETALESYALGAWWKDYDRADAERQSTLMINIKTMEEASPKLSKCNHQLRAEGKPYPRTCAECGLGPCRA